jgi:protein O-mannosyl-transferase
MFRRPRCPSASSHAYPDAVVQSNGDAMSCVGRKRLLPSFPRPDGAVLAGILLVTCGAYWRVLGGDFVFDDVEILRHESQIIDLTRFLQGLFDGGWLTRERPLTELTFALQYAVSGADPRPYHTVNVLLHLANAALVFFLTSRLWRSSGIATWWGPLGVAALFAVHPIQSQAVSYVWQRAELLASLFQLSTILLLLKASDESARPRLVRLGALACYLLGAAAKTVALTAPLAFVLVSLAVPRRDWRSRAVSLIPFVVVLAALAGARILTFESRADVGFHVTGGITPLRYLATQLTVIPLYLRLLAFPVGQTVHHDVTLRASLLEPYVVACAAALLALVLLAGFLAYRSRDGQHARSRLAAVGIGWFFLLLAPTSSIVPLKDLMMEHRVYLAAWGLFLGAALAANWVAGQSSVVVTRAGRLAFLGTLAALVVALHQRNAAWENAHALWSDAVAKAPNTARPWAALGDALERRGDSTGAFRCYQRALEIDDLSVPRHETLGNLAGLLLSQGRTLEALTMLDGALATKPADAALLGSTAHAYLALGDLPRAEAFARRAVAVAPEWADSHRTLGGILGSKGDYGSAAAEFAVAARLSPHELDNVYNLALATSRLGNAEDACRLLLRCASSNSLPLQRRADALRMELRCSVP